MTTEKFCECGCGENIISQPHHKYYISKFVKGHWAKMHQKKDKPKPQLCKCGCGDYANPGYKYINGHNRKGSTLSERHLKILKQKQDKILVEKRRLSQLEYYKNNNHVMKNKQISQDHKDKISKNHSKYWLGKTREHMLDEKHPRWTGGCNAYWHEKAWELFGKYFCEDCGMTLKDHYEIYNQRFHMHNKLLPKDYTVMESYAWNCLCNPEHESLERRLENDSKRNI